MASMLTYSPKDTWIHRLCGATKLSFFLIWSVVGMISYDTRVLAIMLVSSLILFKVSKTSYKQVSTAFKVISFFLVINLIAIFLFSPYEGTKIYGTQNDLFHLAGPYTLTAEQLFYELNVMLKYLTIIPIALMFIVTTDPSEFAASLNRIKVPYSISYAVALALRYIPDVQKEFLDIRQAQEARGIDMSKKAPFLKRVKNMAAILFPLVFSSMERIDRVSSAMELRGFGKRKERTWYSAGPFKKADYAVLGLLIFFAVTALIITFSNGSRFYNPF